MALINCKEPGCTAQVDTALACKEVNSLFGLRVILEHHLENLNFPNLFPEKELKKHLEFVNDKLSKFQIENQEAKFQLFKKNRRKNSETPRHAITQLYIECPKGHRHYYDVDCES